MVLITLERSYLPHCVIGELHIGGLYTYATIERPWLGNKRNVSCIPEGVYECKPHSGTKFKDVWQLMDVPDRSHILIHAGNWSHDVQGCIAVGKALSEKEYMVTHSRQAIDELRDFMPDEFEIRVTYKHPGYP